jgi:hypothetical protein
MLPIITDITADGNKYDRTTEIDFKDDNFLVGPKMTFLLSSIMITTLKISTI